MFACKAMQALRHVSQQDSDVPDEISFGHSDVTEVVPLPLAPMHHRHADTPLAIFNQKGDDPSCVVFRRAYAVEKDRNIPQVIHFFKLLTM